MAPRKSGAYRAEDFLMEFKSVEQIAEEQSQAQIETMIKTWVAAANIMHRRQTMAPKSAA